MKIGHNCGRCSSLDDGGGLLVVGEAEEEAEVLGGETTRRVVLVAARDAGLQGLAERGICVVGIAVVNDVGDELKGERRVDTVAAAVAYLSQPPPYTAEYVIFSRGYQVIRLLGY